MGMYDGQTASNAVVKPATLYLQAGIHTVKFVSVDKGTLEAYNTVDFTFENVDGAVHIERLFEPTSNERKPNRFNSSIEDPSPAEQFMCKLMHIMAAINPVTYQKIQLGQIKFDPSDFDTLVSFIKKIFEPKIGTEVQIKLLPNGRYVGFPGFPAGIDRNGNLYLKTSFIGADLTLSAYEKQAIDKALEARPTSMSSVNKSELDSIQNDFENDDNDDLPF